jgi:glycosyltransferase involved in cell wall biosynthesis
VLVPHEPDDDPRVAWVRQLCEEVSATREIAAMWATTKPTREIRGSTYLERVDVGQIASTTSRRLFRRAVRLQQRPSVAATGARRAGEAPPAASKSRFHEQAATAGWFASTWAYYLTIVDALYRRARAESVRPDVILCHDLYALMAGVALKRLWGSRIVYDSHEYWPQADLLHEPWQERLLTRLERRLVRSADEIVTVSPPLARHMECVYGRRRVWAVPNAAPLPAAWHAQARPPHQPVRFLFQGQAAAGRGLELLVDAWSRLDEDAVLLLRYRDSPFARELARRAAPAIARGAIAPRPPVGEAELVDAAAEADVGVIPYVGPNLNHVFASPNKLSQYMQAGLALLVAQDMAYAAEIVRTNGCGATYDPRDPASLAAAVRRMTTDGDELVAKKRASLDAVERGFHWDALAGPYREALQRALNVRSAPRREGQLVQ